MYKRQVKESRGRLSYLTPDRTKPITARKLGDDFDRAAVLAEMCIRDRLYSNILLKLYLKSLKHGGRLHLDEDIPYTAQIIATITRQQIGTVERALQIF